MTGEAKGGRKDKESNPPEKKMSISMPSL